MNHDIQLSYVGICEKIKFNIKKKTCLYTYKTINYCDYDLFWNLLEFLDKYNYELSNIEKISIIIPYHNIDIDYYIPNTTMKINFFDRKFKRKYVYIEFHQNNIFHIYYKNISHINSFISILNDQL